MQNTLSPSECLAIFDETKGTRILAPDQAVEVEIPATAVSAVATWNFGMTLLILLSNDVLVGHTLGPVEAQRQLTEKET